MLFRSGNLGYLYLDGELMGYSRVNQTPANTLKRDGLEGTPYNWIGRSCYTGDVYLRKTLVYDFSLYDGAITDDNFFEDIRFGIDALNNAYNENPDYIDPSLIDEYNRLTLDGDLQNVVSDLTLPLLGEDPSVTISWESNSKYISSTGVVTRPESLDANVVLTATLKKGLNVMTKTFNLKVKASDPKFASDLLFRHDFLSSMISGQNVTESGEMNYVATLKNGAIIETLSDDSSDESVNVLSLGESGGYRERGSEMGEVLDNRTDYTMSVLYGFDKEYLNLEKNGNALWSIFFYAAKTA